MTRPQRQHRAIGRRRDLDRRPLRAGLGRRGEILAALLEPFHRTSESPRQRGDRDVLGEHLHLEPEPAADVGAHDPHPRVRQTKRIRQGRAHDRRGLVGRPDRERFAIPVGQDAARLERRGRAATVLECLAQDDRRAREGPVDVALSVTALEQDLVGRERLVDARDDRFRLPLDGDQLTRIGRDIGARGHDGRHRFAAKAGDAVGQRRPRRWREAPAIEPGRERLRHRAQVVRGDDGDDPGQDARCRGIDPDDARVRVRAPDEAREEHAREPEVVQVSPSAGQQPRVLEPLDSRARIAQRRRVARAHSPSRWNTRPSRSLG